MNKDHIVILKKIPVDPHHVGSLRLHKDSTIRPVHHQENIDRAHHAEGTSVPTPLAYRIFSSILFFAFLINPIGVAYAEEVIVIPDAPLDQSEEPASEAVVETPEPGVTIVVPPSEEDGVNQEEESTPTVDDTLPPEGTEPNGEDTGEIDTKEDIPPEEEGEQATTTATSTDPLLTEEENSTSTATTTEEHIDNTEGGTGTSTETIVDETASTTEEIAEERAEAAPTNLDREQTPEERAAEREVAEAVMREQIKKEVAAEMRARCVSYGDDGYYCLDENSAERVTDRAPVEQVIASREGGGDKEIILIRSLPEGETRTPITVNDVDDEFPSADGEMRMIVWQSLVDGRWQIAYKEGAGTPEYLTANADGNGHPATDGKRIVWQGWSGGNWDIFLAEPGSAEASFSGTSSSVFAGIHPGWKVSKLSQSASHDMFPKIAGNFVTWQEHQGEEWVIVVYDLSTGQTRTVKGETGGTGEAPTVALIFKERTREGRILIRASDLATGERIPLREDELPPPATLPIPEHDGALPIQNGTSSVTSIRTEGDGDGGTPEI